LVISVGNITTGGTGKTTVTRYLSEEFHKKGKRVVVISHGVGGKRKALIVSDGKNIMASADEAGDEAYLLAKRLPEVPVLSGRFREKMAEVACKKFGAEVIILDDAFHALRLVRDWNILVFNCLNPLGNGHLLPAGPLREPLFNLRRANIFWLNHTDLVNKKEVDRIEKTLLNYNQKARVIRSHYRYQHFCTLSGKIIPNSHLSGKKAFVCVGIGNPEGFLKKIASYQMEIKGKVLFPDHHFYKSSEIKELPLEEVDFLVTTEKDSVRFPKTDAADQIIYPLVEVSVEGDKSLC